jgi:hypothetical protein
MKQSNRGLHIAPGRTEALKLSKTYAEAMGRTPGHQGQALRAVPLLRQIMRATEICCGLVSECFKEQGLKGKTFLTVMQLLPTGWGSNNANANANSFS